MQITIDVPDMEPPSPAQTPARISAREICERSPRDTLTDMETNAWQRAFWRCSQTEPPRLACHYRAIRVPRQPALPRARGRATGFARGALARCGPRGGSIPCEPLRTAPKPPPRQREQAWRVCTCISKCLVSGGGGASARKTGKGGGGPTASSRRRLRPADECPISVEAQIEKGDETADGASCVCLGKKMPWTRAMFCCRSQDVAPPPCRLLTKHRGSR